MNQNKLLTPRAIAAAALTSVIPILITGFFVFRNLRSDDAFFKGAFYSLGFFIILFSMFQLFILNKEINRFYEQVKSGDQTPPSRKVQVFYGVMIGVIIYLSLVVLMILAFLVLS